MHRRSKSNRYDAVAIVEARAPRWPYWRLAASGAVLGALSAFVAPKHSVAPKVTVAPTVAAAPTVDVAPAVDASAIDQAVRNDAAVAAEGAARDVFVADTTIAKAEENAATSPVTNPIKPGLVVPSKYKLPEGYLRYHQATSDGVVTQAILMFSPDHAFVDLNGQPIEVPADRIVRPEQAPYGFPNPTAAVPKPAFDLSVVASADEAGGQIEVAQSPSTSSSDGRLPSQPTLSK